MRAAAFASAMLIAGCSRSRTGLLPDPSPLRVAPMGHLDVANGPGLGPEIVSGNASATGTTISLAASSSGAPVIAVARWSALDAGLVSIDSIAATLPANVDAFVANAGGWTAGTAPVIDAPTSTLLLALVSRSPSPVLIDVALTSSIPSALPAWTPLGSHPVPPLGEPSAIDFDFARRTLWIADDQGRIGELDPATRAVLKSASPGGDLEAIRWVPDLDVLLVSNETLDQLDVFDPDSLALLATAPMVLSSGVTPWIAGGDGFEGLAVTGVTGRTISLVVANQNDPPGYWRGSLTLPLPLAGVTSTLLTSFEPAPAINLSDVMLDWGSRRLFADHGYVLPNTLVLLDGSSLQETASSFVLAQTGAEGATIAPGGFLWIADDTGSVQAYSSR